MVGLYLDPHGKNFRGSPQSHTALEANGELILVSARQAIEMLRRRIKELEGGDSPSMVGYRISLSMFAPVSNNPLNAESVL